MLTRSGTFAIYATLLSAILMILGPVQNFILVIPNMISTLLPAGAEPIGVVISVIFAFSAFWFIFGLVIQRDV